MPGCSAVLYLCRARLQAPRALNCYAYTAPASIPTTEHGLRPADVYGSAGGAIAQLEALEAWFAVQRDFHFYSSSGEQRLCCVVVLRAPAVAAVECAAVGAGSQGPARGAAQLYASSSSGGWAQYSPAGSHLVLHAPGFLMLTRMLPLPPAHSAAAVRGRCHQPGGGQGAFSLFVTLALHTA